MYTWIEIDTFSLMQNVREARERIGEGTKLLAVVKANAYGHDLALASESFWRAGVDGFVVSDARDALTLAQKGWRIPILLLSPPENKDMPQLLEYKVRFAGVSAPFLEQLAFTALRHQTKALVHLELETGMHRTGVRLPEAKELIRQSRSPQSPLLIEGVFTHLYDADNATRTEQQITAVADLLFQLQQEDINLSFNHVLASDGVGNIAEPQFEAGLFDAVRLGRMLYGEGYRAITTTPALTWKTRISTIHPVKRGETVGYSATYTSDRDRLVATLPVGYFDGIDRRLSNKGSVLIQGKRCPIIGRVSMNQAMVDLQPVLRPNLQDEVVLLGPQEQDEITPDDWAEWIGTIGYEVLARIPNHIQRIKVR